MTDKSGLIVHKSHLDMDVFGTDPKNRYAYRRVHDVGHENVESIEPTAAPVEGEYGSVYQWDDQRNRWWWVSDHPTHEEARAEAQRLAGLPENERGPGQLA